ncbi:hypothetical protein [Burkholderia multivorans]|uniref:hypothetical protein n=1 Tax=Burkholderia multivorans TaxID=87883 RepID=UPI001269FCD2|nr:hypothetical protein [Burkholderia multivorans]HDR9474423.1 hypothetical protein [Burkholderia multivorans]HDR9480265.1 hypothetical protein [Burkholderia multivorans]
MKWDIYFYKPALEDGFLKRSNQLVQALPGTRFGPVVKLRHLVFLRYRASQKNADFPKSGGVLPKFDVGDVARQRRNVLKSHEVLCGGLREVINPALHHTETPHFERLNVGILYTVYVVLVR